ncbi:MAG: hypothetical protein WC365_01490 [Candidatus Babeliales bacterium]|jgi:hypothetical protein
MAELGDAVVIVPTSVNAAASLTVRPASGDEWIIHNIFSEDGYPIEVYITDGTNTIKIDANASGGLLGYAFHLTYAVYMTIKNTDASARYISYNGIVSKVTA